MKEKLAGKNITNLSSMVLIRQLLPEVGGAIVVSRCETA